MKFYDKQKRSWNSQIKLRHDSSYNDPEGISKQEFNIIGNVIGEQISELVLNFIVYGELFLITRNILKLKWSATWGRSNP